MSARRVVPDLLGVVMVDVDVGKMENVRNKRCQNRACSVFSKDNNFHFFEIHRADLCIDYHTIDQRHAPTNTY
jgi:hypothetical protein